MVDFSPVKTLHRLSLLLLLAAGLAACQTAGKTGSDTSAPKVAAPSLPKPAKRPHSGSMDGWWKGQITLETAAASSLGSKKICREDGKVSLKVKGATLNGTVRIRKKGFQIVHGEIDEAGNILQLVTTDQEFSLSGNLKNGGFSGEPGDCTGRFRLTRMAG